MSFGYNLSPAMFPFIRTAFQDRGLILVNYGLRVFLNLLSVINPIAAIVILKPVQFALKQGINKCIACTKGSSEEQTNETMFITAE